MLTYSDLKTRVKRLLDEVTSASDNTNALVGEALNASHRRICLSRTWAFMKWPRRETITTVAATRLYALNSSVGRVLDVWNSARHQAVTLVPRRNWEQNGFDLSSSGVQTPAAILGDYWPVAAQPSSASALKITSSSAADTGSAYTVLIRGIDSTGEIAEETLTASGTATVTGSTSFVHVLNVSKIGTWAGTMTLKYGTTTMLALLAAQYGKQYQVLEFIEPPSAAEALTYSFLRVPRTMSNDNDFPDIPFPFSEILAYDTLLDMATYNSDINRQHVVLWKDRFETLLKQLEEAQDGTMIGSQPRFVRDMDAPRSLL